MGIIRRIYDKGEETISFLKKKYKDPLKEFEKEINNLKNFLKESKNLAAHLNALKIRAEKDISSYKEDILKYGKKAEDAVKKASLEEISEEVAEKISLNALKFKKSFQNRINELTDKIPNYDDELILLKDKISDLKTKIEYYENEYNFLKKRTKNKPLTSESFFYGDSGVISRLEKLKNSILKQSQKADFYSENSDEMYGNIKDDEIYNEYSELKKKFKK